MKYSAKSNPIQCDYMAASDSCYLETKRNEAPLRVSVQFSMRPVSVLPPISKLEGAIKRRSVNKYMKSIDAGGSLSLDHWSSSAVGDVKV
ncbi:hypothetical protein Dimus_025713 [Dionaea muscipula]